VPSEAESEAPYETCCVMAFIVLVGSKNKWSSEIWESNMETSLTSSLWSVGTAKSIPEFRVKPLILPLDRFGVQFVLFRN